MKIRMMAVGMVFCLAGSSAAFAHHGGASYDGTKQVTLKGTVTEFDFVNPHTQIYFDVKDDKGNVVHWSCEALSPGKLTRSGWKRDSVKPGEEVTITLAPSKTGAPVGLLRKLILPDGTVLSAMADDTYVAPKE